jgi:hypothetical protein
MRFRYFILFLLVAFNFIQCADDGTKPAKPSFQLQTVSVGPYNLNLTNQALNNNAPLDKPIVATFTVPLNQTSATASILLKIKGGAEVPVSISFQDEGKTFVALPTSALIPKQTYELIIDSNLKGTNGETFAGLTIEFTTEPVTITLSSVIIDGQLATPSNRMKDISLQPAIVITFPVAVNTTTINNTTVKVLGTTPSPTLSFSFSEADKKVTVTSAQSFEHLKKHTLSLTADIVGATGEVFAGYSKIFYTEVDPTPKFPVITDDELLTLVQQQTFKYFYDFAHPASGMARERNTSGDLVTSGGSGFGIMALIVGMERNFITRQQGLDRMDKILDFLETADRFHGVWPHWMNGNTGNVIPFSTNDNGGDLVETSFLIQGLLTFRQYLNSAIPAENALIDRINVLWHGVEWDWYRRCEPTCQNVLYWHWSPDKAWAMNFALYGYFEQQITYFLAAASPTHSIPKIVYSNGYGKNGSIVKNNVYEGITLPLESPAPLFWVHYSYLGLDPHVTDEYTNYWTQNTNASLINQAYCVRNPKNFVGYSDECWGLTSSDSFSGYKAHSPSNDLGVITPTAALSSFPYTPVESMKALKFFYYTMGTRLWGQYGFYDAFSVTDNWYASSYLAIDQGPIIVMIENYRTGLLWNLFMSCPEVQNGLTNLGFTY